VAGGQGTLALELLADLPRLDAVFVPVGGGGLISGIAGAAAGCVHRRCRVAALVRMRMHACPARAGLQPPACWQSSSVHADRSPCAAVLKAAEPRIRIVGCQPAASDVMRRCVAAGRIVDAPSLPTFSDGTAGAHSTLHALHTPECPHHNEAPYDARHRYPSLHLQECAVCLFLDLAMR